VTVHTHVRGWGWALVLTAAMPAVSTAQSAVPATRMSVGAGVGVAVPFHGDFNFTPVTWDADVRLPMSERLLVELAVGDWRRSDAEVRTNLPTTSPPGVIGRLEQATSNVQRTWQVNALLAASLGRVRMTGGGGVGLLQYERRTETTTEDCSAGVSCGTFVSTFSNVSVAVQAVGGAEVHVSRAVAIYGQARFVVPTSDPGGSDLRFTVGARWGL